jgi:hypothetical protein
MLLLCNCGVIARCCSEHSVSCVLWHLLRTVATLKCLLQVLLVLAAAQSCFNAAVLLVDRTVGHLQQLSAYTTALALRVASTAYTAQQRGKVLLSYVPRTAG